MKNGFEANLDIIKDFTDLMFIGISFILKNVEL